MSRSCEETADDLVSALQRDGLYDAVDDARDRFRPWFGRQRVHFYENLLVSVENYRNYVAESVTYVANQDCARVADIERPVRNANRHLDLAVDRIEHDDVRSAVGHLYAARERKVRIMQTLDESDGGEGQRVDGFVRRLLDRGKQSKGERWAEATEQQLYDEHGNLRSDVTSEEIITRYRDWHDGIHRELSSILAVERILSWFILISVVLLPLIAGLTWQADLLPAIIPARSPSRDGIDLTVLSRISFLGLVFLMGVLGSAVNSVRTWPSQVLTLPLEQPKLSVTRPLIVARLIFGGTAAAFTYVLLVSGLTLLGVTPGMVLALAFVAGFSDQLFVSGVQRVTRAGGRTETLSPRVLGEDESRT